MRVTSLSATGFTILSLGFTKLVRASLNCCQAAFAVLSFSGLSSRASTSLINVWMSWGHRGLGWKVGG